MEEILDGENKSSLTIVANSGDNVAMLHGNIDWSTPDIVSGDFVLSGERMDPEIVDFGRLESPLKGFELRTDLIIKDREISAANLRARIGASHATGYARYDAGQNRKEFEVKLQAPHVQTDDFVRLADAWRDNRQGDVVVDADLSADPENRVLVDIFQDFVDELTLEHNFDIQIGVDALDAGTQHMGAVEFGVLADENNFRLEPFKMNLPGGDINAEYVVETTADGVDMRLNIYVERLDYGDLLRLIDPNARQDAGGYIYVDTSLTSSASTTDRLASAIQGDVVLMIIPEDAAAGVLDLWAASLVLAVLPAPEGQNDRKKLNCMVAGFSADEGVMHSDIVLLDATQVIVRGKGTIDIADRTLDMFVAPQAKREKFFSMSTPVTITGSWDDFRIGVAPGGITATLFRWYMALIYVPFKWLTGERFPADGLATCFNATKWDMPTESD